MRVCVWVGRWVGGGGPLIAICPLSSFNGIKRLYISHLLFTLVLKSLYCHYAAVRHHQQA
jgi:hypothetical protein